MIACFDRDEVPGNTWTLGPKPEVESWNGRESARHIRARLDNPDDIGTFA
jgi:hypothetical protein